MSFESDRLCGTAVHSVRYTGAAQAFTTNVVSVLLSRRAEKWYMVARYAEGGAFNIREIEPNWQTEVDKPNLNFVWADQDDSQNNRYHTLKFEKRSGFEVFIKAYSKITQGTRSDETGGTEIPMAKIAACVRLMDGAEMLRLLQVVFCLAAVHILRWGWDQIGWA